MAVAGGSGLLARAVAGALGARRGGALAVARVGGLGALIARSRKAPALLVGHLPDDQGSVVDLFLDAVELGLALGGLALPLGVRGHIDTMGTRAAVPGKIGALPLDYAEAQRAVRSSAGSSSSSAS